MKFQMDVIFKSFESRSLKKALEKAGKITGTHFSKSNPCAFGLQKNIKRWTLLRSPHVHKKSREQFEMVTYKAVLRTSWQSENEMKVFLLALKNLEIYGVQISIKMSSSMYFDLLKKQI
jgi:ribosomal protein S10